MKAPHVKIVPIMLAALVMVPLSHAQERTAAGATETQMSWTALSTKIDAAKNAANEVNIRVNQIAACGRKGLVYGPGEPTRDSDGCVKPFADPTALNQLSTKMDSVISCAGQGRVFNGGSCSSGFMITGGGQCLTPESGPGNGSAWTIRNPWGDAAGCDGGVPVCRGSKVLHLGYGSDTLGENEMANFCKYPGGNACHTQIFLCAQGL
ncbi:hypothetical protein ACSV5K_10295 [Agrobacterium pusense]|uniref:hypothetical protein n=1 Tax=Agrobacterium pusense TaxID=648995 RepID=UPI003FD4B667